MIPNNVDRARIMLRHFSH